MPKAPESSVDLLATLMADPKLLRQLLDSIGDALFVVDSKHDVVFWNQRAEQLTGYSAAEVLGRHCLAGIRCENCLYHCGLFEKGELSDVRVELTRKDGQKLKVAKTAFVIRDERGEVLGGVEWLRDESELSARVESCRLQRGIIEERERLQAAVLGSIQEGVITIDADWRITSFSRRAEVITGLHAVDVLGKFCHEVIGSALCRDGCPAQHCLESGEDLAERTTTISTAKGLSLPVAEIAVPLRGEGGEALGSVLLIEDRAQQAEVIDQARRSAQFAGMIGRSEAMRRVFRIIEQVADNEVTVLITGPSGSGKEMVAVALHRLSSRRNGPFEAINCAALPEALLESELFGHVKGAFTGAVRDRPGRVESARGGTLFLDEVAETSPALQAKLLRFLQEREYQRVGENLTRPADVRVVAATNRDLGRAVAEGAFREDLYYRLRVIPIEMPSLEERPDDIPLLAAHLLEKIGAERGRSALSLAPATMQRLLHHAWPGNVRELINALEYAVALAPGRRIRPEDLPPELAGARRRYTATNADEGQEQERILDALEQHGGNRTRAAKVLGMDRVTLYRKMKKFGMS